MTENEGKLIVEIGFGDRPFPLQGSRSLMPHEQYLGIENFVRVQPDSLKFTRARLVAVAGARAELIGIEGNQLPLDSRSADEIIMANVLGDPLVNHQDVILAESVRVLKDLGLLTVVETYTPGNFELSRLEAYLRRSGMKRMNNGRERDRKDIRRYNSYNSSDRYIAVFQRD